MPTALPHRRPSVLDVLDDYLTVKEVAAKLNCGTMTVYRLIHAGELRRIRVGRSIRVPARALVAYLHQDGNDPADFLGPAQRDAGVAR